jgi:hypothetical protein
MAKREKIIILLMIVSILYGVYSFFLTSPPEPPEDTEDMTIEALNQFVVGAAQELFSEKTVAVDDYILSQAASAWQKDPFMPTGPGHGSQNAAKKMELEQRQAIRLAYTGYIEVSDKRLAIINDLEYETGEALNQPGYYVKQITPKRVVVGIEGETQNIILPLEEQ